MAKYKRVHYQSLIVKNNEKGGAFLVNIIKLDDNQEVVESHNSAWRTLATGKKHVSAYIGKRPKWEVNEDKTVAKALTEVKVPIE